MRVWSAVAAGALVLGAGCAEEMDDQDEMSLEEQTAAFRSAVEAIQVKYEQWEAAGQADSIAALYTENAVVAFPNAPIVTGRQAIRDAALQAYAMGTATVDIRTESAMANGDLGVERGTYVYDMTPGPDAPAGMAALFPDSGSYLAHWHRVNGQWMLAELVTNSMKPLPGMPAMPAMPAPEGR